MSPNKLDKIFQPESIAVFGASSNRQKVGNTVLRNLLDGEFEGTLLAINPKYDSVENVVCLAELSSASNSAVDLAIVCTPAKTVPSIIRQCGASGVGGIVILTAGFQESGAEGAELQREAQKAASEFPQLRIVGPNCVGIVSPHSKLNASFARGMPAKGRVTFISQSGALCTSVLDWALSERIGFANFVSVGNMMDVGLGELIDYFADDPNTDSLVLYVESIQDAARFTDAACRFAAVKPIIAYKAGRFAQSAAAAASHTGALAGEDVVYDTVFRRIGIDRVFSIEEMFDTAEILSRRIKARGSRLAIVSNAGGPGVMATDALIQIGGSLASLSSETVAELDLSLPPNWSKQNPVDVIGDATPERLGIATQTVLGDSGVDAVLVIVSPQAMTDPTSCADEIIKLAAESEKPVLTSWMGGRAMSEAIEKLNSADIPTFPTPERAVLAFQHLVKYEKTRQRLLDSPNPSSSLALVSELEKPAVPVSGLITEINAKQLLTQYGIEVVPTRLAKSPDEAVEIADSFGYPVVLKIASPEISHKSDIGGVKLNLENQKQVIEAYRQVISAAHEHAPQEIVMGVSVQPMIDIRDGHELIAGSKRDPMFGPVVMIGTGGIYAEVFKDVAFELPPLNESLATSMLRSLNSWKILNGFRGQPRLNISRVADVLIQLSKLVVDHPEIAELDINPLLVTPEKAIALDARIILRQMSDIESNAETMQLLS